MLTILALFIFSACNGDDDTGSTAPSPTPQSAIEQPSTTAQPSEPTQEAEPSPTASDTDDATEVPEEQPTGTEAETATQAPTATPEPEQSVDLDSLAIQVQEVTSGLDTPVKVVSAYDGSNRIFIVEKEGTVSVVLDGVVQEGTFLAIQERVGSEGSEQGLLGLAFHPDFASNGLFFVNYTDTAGNTVISRFETSDDGTTANPDSESILMTIEQPAANHNGGHLLFGPDGYLYIGTGDGGGSGDTYDNAQNGSTLLGAMLRIDVDSGDPYGIPEDNPFVGDDAVLDEIWAIGLRNPWRYDFDSETGDLYIADVGQNQIEEVNVQPAASNGGENYGWPIMEGFSCFEAEECDQSGLTLPVTQYTHDLGCSVTGGNVYRGGSFPAMQGVYFYSDFCSGNVWGLLNVNGEWQSRLLLETGYNVSSFGEDEAGEVYLVDMNSGTLYQVVAE